MINNILSDAAEACALCVFLASIWAWAQAAAPVVGG